MSPTTFKNIHSWNLRRILVGPTCMGAVRNILVDSNISDLGKHALIGAHRKLLVIEQHVLTLTTRVVCILQALDPTAVQRDVRRA